MRLSLRLAVACVPALLIGSASADPCSSTTLLGPQVSYDKAKACLDSSFPFPSNVRVKTAASIKALITNSYVFQDLAADPPAVPGLTLKTASIVSDIDAFLASPTTAALTDRAFHEGLSDILIKARDAHLSYRANCFLAFSFDHGFVMGDMIDYSGSRTLLVVETLPSFATLSSLTFSAQGCNVVTINDKPAFDYIQAWADDHLDISKDAAIRYGKTKGSADGPINRLNATAPRWFYCAYSRLFSFFLSSLFIH